MDKKNLCKAVIIIVVILIISFLSFKVGQIKTLNTLTERSFDQIEIDETLKKTLMYESRKHLKDNKHLLEFSDLKYFEDKKIIQFSLTPLDSDVDYAMLFVEVSKDGNLEFIGPGTAFPDLSERYPGTFN